MATQPSASFDLRRDLAACLGFYTRLPVGGEPVPSFAQAQWAAPLAGAMVGLVVGLVLVGGALIGLTAGIVAAVALAASALLTGALHEDGLADVADGFGGGRTVDDKLAIMKDSRIGTYGAIALVLSLLARWSALAALAGVHAMLVIWVLVAVHTASRAPIPLFMGRLPAARPGGLSAGVGAVPAVTAYVALAIGAVVLLPLGPAFVLAAILLLAVLFVSLERLAMRQIGGHTGDVLGALQQGGEIALLALAAALLT